MQLIRDKIKTAKDQEDIEEILKMEWPEGAFLKVKLEKKGKQKTDHAQVIILEENTEKDSAMSALTEQVCTPPAGLGLE